MLIKKADDIPMNIIAMSSGRTKPSLSEVTICGAQAGGLEQQ